jgi:hypothetical protein
VVEILEVLVAENGYQRRRREGAYEATLGIAYSEGRNTCMNGPACGRFPVATETHDFAATFFRQLSDRHGRVAGEDFFYGGRTCKPASIGQNKHVRRIVILLPD